MVIGPVTFEFTPVSLDGTGKGQRIRSRLPARSGVFRIFDVHDSLILLDKTSHLAQRIERFFVGDTDARDLDLRRITGRVEYCRTDSPFETFYLLHAERRRSFPKAYRKMKTFPLVRLLEIDPGLRFPRLETVRRAEPGRWTFGPFRSRNELEKLKVDMERTFRLRPCEYDIQGNDPYPDCIYFQMRTCSKPCNGDIGRETYMADIRAAAAFIEGGEAPILEELHDSIESLSAQLRFEEAAELGKRVERIVEARRSHPRGHFRVDRFHAIVLLDSGSVRTRKVGYVRNGHIQGIEEVDRGRIGEQVDEAIRTSAESPAPEKPPEHRYEDFCLVARFMTHPVGSVRVIPYTDGRPEEVVDAVRLWISGG